MLQWIRRFMPLTTTDIVVGATTLASFAVLYEQSKMSTLPLPPGPRRWPVFGSIFSMPGDNDMREKFGEWKNKYGDVVYSRVLDQDIIILNSREAAFELLECRSYKYSDRPRLVMANELVGWGYSLATMGYGDRHKRMRKLFHEGMSAKAMEKLGYMLEHETIKFIQNLLETPEKLQSHARKATNATVFKVTYGYNVKDVDDPILAKAEETVDMFSYVTLPGTWLVDSFPSLKHLPWAPFKTKAQGWQKLVHEFRDMPADYTLNQMAQGKNEPSLMSNWFERAEEQPGGKTDEDDLFIKWAGASIYGGATDTTISSYLTFFLAMIYNPEAQKNAQAEIDHLIGNDRLPKLSDRDSLPYVEALYKEVLRWQPVAPFAIPHRLGPEEDTYQGMRIPVGCLLIPNIWGMSRDLKFYQDPEAFRPERFIDTATHEAEFDPQNYVFGFGRRRCPGIHLAQASVWLAIVTVLAVYDITPALDASGQPIMPDLKYSQSTIRNIPPNTVLCRLSASIRNAVKNIYDRWYQFILCIIAWQALMKVMKRSLSRRSRAHASILPRSTMAAIDPLEVPPFQLQPLLRDINPHIGDLLDLGQNREPPTPAVSSPLDLFARVSNSAIGKSAPKPPQPQAQVIVRCAQALGRDVYVGNSDGTLVRYSLKDGGTLRDGNSYQVTGRQTLTSRRPIDQIVLIPCIAKLLVLSANTLHFYNLPGIEPVPQALIQSMTRVLAFAVDEHAIFTSPKSQGAPIEPVELCVFVRGHVRIFSLRERLLHIREAPLPSALSAPRRWGSTVCAADAENYNIIDLNTLSFLPVMPIPSMSSPGAPPRIIPSGDGGFVVLQASGEGSIAVFLTAGGDPGGALIEMPRFPVDIALDPPHFIALLPNNTIEIHNYTQQPPQLVQIIPRPEDFAPHTLSMGGGSGYLVSAGERDSKLSTTRIPLSLNPSEDKQGIKIDINAIGQSGSGLTPPSTPSPPSKDHKPTSYARSRILLTSNNATQSLVPTTLLSQAESLLGAGRENDVIRLLDTVRKKTGDEDQDVQLRYIYTQLGYAKLRETHFEEAGNYFFRAETDARALIRLFPDLCEGLPEYVDPEETMPVFKGLEETVRAAKSVEETVRNYSPHLGEGEEPLVTLRDILTGNSRDMLRAFLHKTRNRRRYGRPQAKRVNEDGSVWKAVDTVLARLFAEAGEITELLDLIKDSTSLTIQAIEPALVKHRQFQALIALCAKLDDEPRLVSVLAKLHDAEYVDANGGVKGPFERIIQILKRTQDVVLVQQYGIWVLKHDPALGLEIFTSRTIPKLDDAAVLADMQSVNTLAASRFLEHVVLNKRSSDPNLHNQLVVRYVDEAIAILEKPGVQHLFSEIAQEYIKLPPNPYLLHVANNDAMPEALDVRIRLALFLQGSNLYNPRTVREKLQARNANEIFAYERAIIDGKLGHHRKALTILVHEVHDSVSAEVYCALGGVVIPPKVANSVGERRRMQSHALLVSVSGRRNVSVTEEKRRELLKTLMEVYTLGGEATAIQTAQLLNSQARNFDAVQVLEAIPESWSLSVISSFLERSLRRTMHESREGMILKHISAGQNLTAVDDAMQVIKDEGYVVEEADDDDADSDAILQQDPLDLDGPSSLVSEGLKRKEGWNEDDVII
ncbi:O-methylsterigmatocystin oxidoreductase [Rhizoctonia solani]|uniref:O-methylsterigmatocystin oxidoreductase n=1 Tax=Rhizoctonia solani TaxID=456999 RepID=A0A0K6G4Z9_9AGAM|nr:O-methylsterigmatocystin oxidoreductase [Rhizoctonia solani]